MSAEVNTIYVLFLFLLFVVAFLYSSVGHGGASGYLALMALFGIAPAIMKSSALVMNICVSLISFIHYYKGGHFKWKMFLPFAFASVPASFLGALITVDATMYKKILGILLIFPVLRLLGVFGKENEETKKMNNLIAVLLGVSIGFLSGMIGIGGGIVLSPLILLFHWANMKETAAISALFIFVNSVSALGGLFMKGLSIDTSVYLWLVITLTGGFAGAYFGSKKMKNPVLKKILAAVLLLASIKLLVTHTK
ncbi:MAG: sulfite exporter TauE/SafE family protein [Bacteroidetes bacterium]|nr:MAG: sulfite exporter TauE/SafE family protein [Bacteroidota bacterium]